MRTFGPINVGSLVWFRLPENRPSIDSPSMKEYVSNYPLWAAKFAKKHNGFLKPVAGLAGDAICRDKNIFSINGKQTGPRIEGVDQNGNLLPFWSGCIHLTTQQLAVFSGYAQDSLDSRLFGAIDAAESIPYKPLWLF